MSKRVKYLILVFSSLGPFMLSVFLKFIDAFFMTGMGDGESMSGYIVTISNWLITVSFLISLIAVAIIGIMEAFQMEADSRSFTPKELNAMHSLREKLFVSTLESVNSDLKK